MVYPDNSSESLANSFFIGVPGSANNGYTGSSTLGTYQVAAGSKVLGPGDTVSILMQFFSFGDLGPELQAGTGLITVITSGGRHTDIPLTDVRVGFMNGNSGIAVTHGTITQEYPVDFIYPDAAVHGGVLPLYDAAFSNLYLVALTPTPPVPVVADAWFALMGPARPRA